MSYEQLSKQNDLTFHLGLLQEESAEIIQAVSKIRRFGMADRYPDNAPTNKEKLELEVKDLLIVIMLLEENFELDLTPSTMDVRAKLEKIKKYKEYTNRLGLLG